MQEQFTQFVTKLTEKKSYLFFAIPFLFIIIAVIASLVLLQQPSEETTIQPTPAPTIIQEKIEEPIREDITTSPEEDIETITDPTTKILLEQQALAEEQFAQEQEAVQKAYPWISNLPFQAENYFFYFDVENERFIGKLYPQTLSPTPIETQAEAMKTQIRERAATIGIPLTNYRIDWIVTPE